MMNVLCRILAVFVVTVSVCGLLIAAWTSGYWNGQQDRYSQSQLRETRMIKPLTMEELDRLNGLREKARKYGSNEDLENWNAAIWNAYPSIDSELRKALTMKASHPNAE